MNAGPLLGGLPPSPVLQLTVHTNTTSLEGISGVSRGVICVERVICVDGKSAQSYRDI